MSLSSYAEWTIASDKSAISSGLEIRYSSRACWDCFTLPRAWFLNHAWLYFAFASSIAYSYLLRFCLYSSAATWSISGISSSGSSFTLNTWVSMVFILARKSKNLPLLGWGSPVEKYCIDAIVCERACLSYGLIGLTPFCTRSLRLFRILILSGSPYILRAICSMVAT